MKGASVHACSMAPEGSCAYPVDRGCFPQRSAGSAKAAGPIWLGTPAKLLTPRAAHSL